MAGPSSAPLALFLAAAGFSTLYAGSFDAMLLAFFSVFRQRHLLADHVDTRLVQEAAKVAATTLLTTLLALQAFRMLRKVNEPTWEGPGKVLLFPSRTTHSRLFPKKHSFSYSYLVVGVPVGWEGIAGGMVSVGADKGWSFSSWASLSPGAGNGWYTINPGDYLERGKAELGLRGKLDAYIVTQGVEPAKYPYAYLVTAARFLGYHFNPVSFWYLYDANKSLAAMILEVNNTFDERRMYFLTPDDDPTRQIDGSPAPGERGTRRDAPSRTLLRQSWPKDFHVSPFNSRNGSYSLVATDPLLPRMQGIGPIVSTINLISSKGHGKLVARLVPDGHAVDPCTMTAFQKLKFLMSWWWVGFLTFPRIVKEAGLLFFRRKLHVWYRPEPLKQSIGRHADSTERQLEPIFRRYLRHLVEQSSSPLAVKYVPSGIPEAVSEVMLSFEAQDGTGSLEEMEFKVLTPLFYSRFVYYAHDMEALFCELQESCTIWVSRPDLLPKFVLKKPAPTLVSSNCLEFVYFKIMKNLRVRPQRIERPLTSSAPTTNKGIGVDIRDFRISSMDGYVLSYESDAARVAYRNCVLKLFLADRVALGIVPLLEAERLILQTWSAWHVSIIIGQVLVALTLYLGNKFGG